MTITLHWWALPLAIFAITTIWAWISSANDSGMFAGMGQAVVWIGSIVVSLAIVAGHFL